MSQEEGFNVQVANAEELTDENKILSPEIEVEHEQEDEVPESTTNSNDQTEGQWVPESYNNSVWQHIVMFLLVTFSSGALYSWLVVEYHFTAANMVG